MFLKLKNPATYLIAGVTCSGKSTFVKELIKNKNEVFENPPTNILYLYGTWQNSFDDMEKMKNIDFHKGLPDEELLKKYYNDKSHCLILIDDLMCSASGSKSIHDIYYKDAHHTNTSCIMIVQNLFAKNLRGISLNSHYLILFKSPRIIGQIGHIGSQLGFAKLLKEAYLDACKQPYSYLLIDLHPTTEEQFCLRSKILPNEETIIYRE